MASTLPDFRLIAADIGIELNADGVAMLERLAKKTKRKSLGCLTEPNGCGWRVWVKSRLGELGILCAGCCGQPEINAWVILHVFNLFRADVLESTGLYVMPVEVARSGIVRGHRVPHPIDRVAGRVAPGDPKRK